MDQNYLCENFHRVSNSSHLINQNTLSRNCIRLMVLHTKNVKFKYNRGLQDFEFVFLKKKRKMWKNKKIMEKYQKFIKKRLDLTYLSENFHQDSNSDKLINQNTLSWNSTRSCGNFRKFTKIPCFLMKNHPKVTKIWIFDSLFRSIPS